MARTSWGKAPPTRAAAILTSVTRYGERDLVVRGLTRTAGRLGVFARGGQRLAKRGAKQGAAALSAPAWGTLTWRPRADGALAQHVDFEPDVAVLGMAMDPLRLARAAYVAELCERLLPEAMPEPDLFDAAAAALRALADGAGGDVLRTFEMVMLVGTGYDPAEVGAAVLGAADEQRGRGALSGAAEAAIGAMLSAPYGPYAPLEPGVSRELGRLFVRHLRAENVELKAVRVLRALGATGRPAQTR